ncbi:MAG: putative DNA modification/repair radical SAM protein, partial [Candidatus Methanomethylicota archaeon]
KHAMKFSPSELATSFISLVNQNLVDGLFLSSGVGKDPEDTMDEMLEAIELIRFKYGFNGYIHLKILPGVSYHQVKRACELANRVSINQEVPTQSRLAELSSQKDLKNDIVVKQRQIKVLQNKYGKGKQTTQYVVGAAGESDLEILRAVYLNYQELEMGRVYYSAFTPIANTPLENKAPTSKLREHRLYQADFLMRKYGFTLKELQTVLDEKGMLPLNVDPKTAYALVNRELYPVDVNDADYWTLIRVPGIGPKTAKRILAYRRRRGLIMSLKQLKELGVITYKAQSFIRLNGWQNTLDVYFTNLAYA